MLTFTLSPSRRSGRARGFFFGIRRLPKASRAIQRMGIAGGQVTPKNLLAKRFQKEMLLLILQLIQ